MKLPTIALLLVILPTVVLHADQPVGTVILDDNFNRSEKDPKKEQIGNGWGTNSAKRAKGVKQVDLVDGALHITRAKVADHGVSVTHDLQFKDAMIELRFKIGANDDLGINIADMKEKSVHAGHICMARVRPTNLEIADLKTGRMDKEIRERRLAKKSTKADNEQLKKTVKRQKLQLKPDEWHNLKVIVKDQTMTVTIDGKKAGEFTSPGIGHATKSRLRLAVGKSAWVDDVKVTRLK